VVKKIIERILIGVIKGLIYYIVFVHVLPFFLDIALGFPIEVIEPLTFSLLIGVFISLGIISSITKPFIGIIFSSLSFMLGLLILLDIISLGVAEVPMTVRGVKISAAFEFKPLLLIIIGFSIIFIIIGIFEKIIHGEE